MRLNLSIRLLLVHFCIFLPICLVVSIEKCNFAARYFLKSVVFVCQKLLKSVNGYTVQEDYIIHRGLSEVR